MSEIKITNYKQIQKKKQFDTNIYMLNDSNWCEDNEFLLYIFFVGSICMERFSISNYLIVFVFCRVVTLWVYTFIIFYECIYKLSNLININNHLWFGRLTK